MRNIIQNGLFVIQKEEKKMCTLFFILFFSLFCFCSLDILRPKLIHAELFGCFIILNFVSPLASAAVQFLVLK